MNNKNQVKGIALGIAIGVAVGVATDNAGTLVGHRRRYWGGRRYDRKGEP
ncbi:hypothetical protein NYZ99_14760 [Maribacter litopenaei]|uniref:Glycine zipper 2TM domain-containing protein n=1 Tax=Maribacter litopenaei TaxID=2976127 RepID=A0ABY5Y5E4_9FLAO|nr:hypothetical protein [Maribacter litopenaei]UWX54218.1 hypothetical protein NYZ99_14760 [Maribacter litopenaei]